MTNKRRKKKINKTNLWAIIVSCIAIFAFVCLIAGVIIIGVLLQDKPTLNLQDFEQQESSIIYDSKGNEIANLGSVIRQNVEYAEIPNSVVDAFVSIEDSRFFEHGGFDIPRFTKAILENLRTMSFGQGGSTFTMQLVKNTYFTNDDTGEEASRTGVSGIRRKVQEIALAFELESYEPKQFIFESYLNKLNFGGDRNIRGIEKAAQYYFSKSVSELNVNEAALLAGVINAPNYYNPFYNPEAAQEREEEVLYQMYHHGYLSKDEYDLAKNVKVVNLLKDPYASNKGNDNEGIPYQAYVDAVVSEVINLTGIDPYSTTMHIYTYMNIDIQKVMDDIQGQGAEDYVGFPDDYMEAASVCIDNSTGQVVGILGGRNYASGGQLLLNHATEQYKQPGSSIKPILDYALAFENLGWATDHVIEDVPMTYGEGDAAVYNFDNTFHGQTVLRDAVGNSVNTCAIQTLKDVLKKTKYEYVVNYCKSLGYDFTLDDFNVQYAIGGSTCEVSPYQHAGAYASLFNNGIYNTPHTVSRIEFTNGKSPFTPVYESKQVLSEQAAFLTTELMKSNVKSYGGSYNYVKNDDYTVYGKTGTTDWGTAGKEFDIPNGANKDVWLVAATSEYTTVTWAGYEKAVKGQQSYITSDCYYNIRPQARIAHLILDACYQYGGSKPTDIAKPSGITSFSHILGDGYYDSKTNTYVYISPNIDGIDLSENEYITISNGMAKSDTLKIATKQVKKDINYSPEGSTATVVKGDTTDALLALNWAALPKDVNSKNIEKVEEKTSSIESLNETKTYSYNYNHLYDDSWIFGPVLYKADVTITHSDGNVEKLETISSNDDNYTQRIGDIRDGATIKVSMYYQYQNAKEQTKAVEITIEEKELLRDDVRVPGANTSKKDLESWCGKKEVNATFKEKSATSSNPSGTFYIEDSNGRTYYAGDTISGLSITTDLTCYYFVSVKPEVRITDSKDNTYSYTLLNGEAESIKWSCSGPCEIDDDTAKTVTITFTNKGKCELTIYIETDNGDCDDTIEIKEY